MSSNNISLCINSINRGTTTRDDYGIHLLLRQITLLSHTQLSLAPSARRVHTLQHSIAQYILPSSISVMSPSAELDPLVGSSIFALIVAVLATHTVKKSAARKQVKAADESTGVDEVAGLYMPAMAMPGREPDDVVKYYLKDLAEEESFQETVAIIDSKDTDTPDEWVPRHKDLVRLTGRHPFNCEAPLSALHEKGFITPSSLHYVRNHGACPKIAWENHTIDIGGLAPKPITLKMKDIIALPAHSLPVTLVCCGNRRKEQNMIKQTIGFNWGAAGVSTGVWTGARLIDILKLAGVEGIDNWAEGHHIRFASDSDKGGDKLPGGVYGTSVTLEKAVSFIWRHISDHIISLELHISDHRN